MSNIAILDTSVYVDDLRTGRHKNRIEAMTYLVRTSSVVLSELWRGARKASEREFLKALTSNHPVLTPTTKNWLESGQILSRIASDQVPSTEKLRDLHFDVLIALTARNYGAKLVTSNRSDFELIRSYRTFQMEVW
jgi:predicted nucleic acid-binding protein